MTDEQLKALVLSIADRWRETPFSYCGGYPDMVTLGHDELHRLVAKVRADALEEAITAIKKLGCSTDGVWWNYDLMDAAGVVENLRSLK